MYSEIEKQCCTLGYKVNVPWEEKVVFCTCLLIGDEKNNTDVLGYSDVLVNITLFSSFFFKHFKTSGNNEKYCVAFLTRVPSLNQIIHGI